MIDPNQTPSKLFGVLGYGVVSNLNSDFKSPRDTKVMNQVDKEYTEMTSQPSWLVLAGVGVGIMVINVIMLLECITA